MSASLDRSPTAVAPPRPVHLVRQLEERLGRLVVPATWNGHPGLEVRDRHVDRTYFLALDVAPAPGDVESFIATVARGKEPGA